MAAMAKRLRPDDLQTLQQFRQKRLRALVRDALFLTICLGIFFVGHVGMVWYNGTALQRGWLSNIFLVSFILATIGLYLALAPLCTLLIRFLNIHALPRVLHWQNALFLNLYLLISLPIVLLITTIWKPFRFLHVGFFDDITGRCLCVTIVACILLFLTRRVLPFPRFSQTLRQIILGITLAILFSFAIGLLMPFSWLSFHFESTRVWQGCILFAMLWPVFLLHEGVVHNWAEKHTLPAFLLSLSVRVCLLAIVSVFAMLSLEKAFLEFIWPTPVVVFLSLQYCCSLLYKKGRAAIAGATLSACMMAWVLTAHLTPVNL